MTRSRSFFDAVDSPRSELANPRTATQSGDLIETEQLLTRFRSGDAEAVGEFLHRYGPLVRAHYRRKIGRSMQRLVDSQDLLSTIARRLCQRVQSQRVEAANSKQLWALVYRIGNDALIDRVKITSRLRSLEDAESPFVHALRSRLSGERVGSASEFAEELAQILEALPAHTDRELLIHWLHGESLSAIGDALGLSAAATRQRWRRLRSSLRDHWERDGASNSRTR